MKKEYNEIIIAVRRTKEKRDGKPEADAHKSIKY
ncbi:hypothetical protein PF672P2_00038 [Parabacteroides phage PF672P2]|nr:hypothetical protein PF672P2_00038 [Parabacteroides phage PF672P2]